MITSRDTKLVEQARNMREVEDHGEPSEWFDKRVINFDLGYTSTPPKCLQQITFKIVKEIEAHEEQRKNERSPSAKKKLTQCVQALVLNLEHTRRMLHACDTLYLAISRTPHDYTDKNGREFQGVSYRHFLAAVDAMESEELGYIRTHKEGYKDSKTGKGYRTLIDGTDKLFSLISQAIGDKTINFYPWRKALKKNFVFIKDEDKDYQQYEHTKTTEKYQSNLVKINKLLLNSDIRLQLPENEMDKFLDVLDKWADQDDYRSRYIDMSAVILHRTFNNNDWEQGGRFYGGWWQNIPEKYRKHITINGEQTIELDYSKMHPTLLYAKEGIKLTENPYLPFEDIDEDYGKTGFNALLNINEDDKQPRKPKGFKDIEAQTGITWKEFLEEITNQHECISHYFKTGYGLKLQYIDSQIAESVLLHFTNKEIPCLPIHDSFIVAKQHYAELESVMHSKFMDHTGFIIRVKEKQ